MSYRSLNTKPLNATMKSLLKRGVHLGLGLGAFTPVLVLANPTGGQVIAGTATITNLNANNTVVKETSSAAIIDWQQFNIGKGQYVRFLQPSSSSIILNRVIGGGGSSIYGSLTGNGQIFLINTNGVFFGKGSSIDAQGFLASTLDINDSDFLARNFVFDKTGSDASVINQGNITAHKGGYVVLAGDYTENDGIIAAQSGHIILASGTKSTLTLNGNSLVSYAVNQATLANLAGVSNAGKLQADGGTVIMTADVANLLKATVVNNTGLIEANGISKSGGTIELLATGGNISNAGTLDVSAHNAGQQGGDITLKGDGKTTLTATSNIDATGDQANGGNVELSGQTVYVRGMADIGRGGNLLMDPSFVTIKTGNGNVNGLSGGFGAGSGSIGTGFIAGKLNAGVNVTIDAEKQITNSANAKSITATGAGNLTLKIGDQGTIALSGLAINMGGAFDTSIVGTHSVSAMPGFADATVKLGFLKAKSVDIEAGSGSIVVHGASGATLKKSVVTTGGNLIMDADNLKASAGSKGLQLSAAGNLDLSTPITGYSHDVDLKATGNVEVSRISAGGNISIAAPHIGFNHFGTTLRLQAGGNLTVAGQLGSSSGAVLNAKHLDLVAGSKGTIKLSKDIKDDGSITFTAGHLAYTGTTPFTVTAHSGSIHDDAAIGSSKGLAHYAVSFTASGTAGDVFVENNVYTTKSISVTGPNVVVGGSNSAPMTLFADDGNATTTADDITLHATGSVGQVEIRPRSAIAGSGSVDHSVTIHAGQDVIMKGYDVALVMGDAKAVINSSSHAVAAATAKADLTVSAGHDVDISAANSVLIGATSRLSSLAHLFGTQSDYAHVDHDDKSSATATAISNVSVSAGDDITINAITDNVTVQGGEEDVYAATAVKGQTVTATASGTVSLDAGRDLSFTAGHDLHVQGGDGFSASHQPDFVQAGNSSAKAVGITSAGVTLTGGHTVALKAATGVMLRAGSNAAGPTDHACGISCSAHSGAQLKATQSKAGAKLVATSTLSIDAGSGGFKASAGTASVDLLGGKDAAVALSASGSADGNKVTAKVVATATLTTTGAVTLHGKNLVVVGGVDAAGMATSTNGLFRTAVDAKANAAGSADDVTLTADTGVSVSGAKGITLAASGALLIVAGGAAAAEQVQISKTGHGGSAAVDADASVQLTAAGGPVTLTNTAGVVYLEAGDDNAELAHLTGSYGGHATLDTKSAISITAGGAFKASAAGSVEMNGGPGNDAYYAAVTAQHSGLASLAADASVTLKAASAAFVGSAVKLGAGSSYHAYHAHVLGKSEGQASLSETSNLTITTAGLFTADAHTGNLSIWGARKNNLTNAFASASNGGQADLTATGAVTVTAGGAIKLTAVAGNLLIDAGNSSADSAAAHATNKAKANISGDTGVTIAAAGDLTASAGANLHVSGGASAAAVGKASGQSSAAAGVTAKADVTLSGNHVTLTAKGLDLFVQGGILTATQASVTGIDHGVAEVTGTATVAISAKSAFTASLAGSLASGFMKVGAGGSVADDVIATGSYGGKAAASGDDSVKIGVSAGSLTLTTGNRTGATQINVQAGYAADSIALHAEYGAASVSGKADVSLSAKGAVTVAAQHGALFIFTSADDVKGGKATASGAGAIANIDAEDAVGITAGGALSLTAGGVMKVHAGASDMRSETIAANLGGVSKLNAKSGISITAGGTFTATAGSDLAIYGGSKNGSGDKGFAYVDGIVSLSDDASVAVTGAAISLTAGKDLAIYGGFTGVANSASIYASSGGKAGMTAKSAVSLTATTGAFTAKAAGNLAVGNIATSPHASTHSAIYTDYGRNAYKAVETADVNARTSLTADTSVNVSANAVTLSAGGSSLRLQGQGRTVLNSHNSSDHYGLASGDRVEAENHGTVTVTTDAGANISAKTTFSAKLTGAGPHAAIYIQGGSDVADDLGAYANTDAGGVAKVSADAGVQIVAGGAVSITATSGKLSLYAGSDIGYDAFAEAEYNGAKSSLVADGSVKVKAGGSLTLTAGGGNLSIHGGKSDGAATKTEGEEGATANLTAIGNVSFSAGAAFTATAKDALTAIGGNKAGDGAVAEGYYQGGNGTFVADGSLSIKAGGAVSLTGDGMAVYSGKSNGAQAEASASQHGVATLNVTDQVNIAGKGAVKLSAGTGELSIYGASYNGYLAEAIAGSFATATMTMTDGVSIKGASVGLTAGAEAQIHGGYYDLDKFKGTQGSGGIAKISATGDSGVNITATAGGVTTKAGSDLYISAGDYGGQSAQLKGAGVGTKITVSGDQSVNIQGTTVALSAGSDLQVLGGYKLGGSAQVSAKQAGVVSLGLISQVSITAAHAVTAKLTGLVGGDHMEIDGYSYVGMKALVTGSSGGVAAEVADAGVNIKVTAAGGTVTLSTGKDPNTSLEINALDSTAKDAKAVAKTGGVATLTATNSVAISALGAVTLGASHGSILIGAESDAAESAGATATDVGSKATVSASQSVSVKGGSVAITAGSNVKIFGGKKAAGNLASAAAASGGVAKLSLDASTTITAAGNLTISGSGMQIDGGKSDTGNSAAATAKHGATAKVTLNTSANLSAGGAISLKATKSSLSIFGGKSDDKDTVALASDHAAATLLAQAGVNVKAGGAFTVQAQHDLSIFGGTNVGSSAHAFASGSAAKASLSAQDNVSITAGGSVTLKSGTAANDTLGILDAGSIGRAAKTKAGIGDTAALTADAQVTIQAGSTLTAGAGGKMLVRGGFNVGIGASVSGAGGAASLTDDANVSLSAAGAVALALNNGALSFLGGTGAYNAQAHAAQPAGSAKLDADVSVSVFAGAGLKVSGASAIKESGGGFPAASHQVQVVDTFAGNATADLVQSVTLSGTSLTFNVTPTKHNGANAVDAGGVTETGTVSNTVHAASAAASVAVESLAPLDEVMRMLSEAAPSTTALGVQDIGLHIGTTAVPLAGLGSQGLPIQLETLMALPLTRDVPVLPTSVGGTRFDPERSQGYLGSSSGQVLLQGCTGRYRSIHGAGMEWWSFPAE